MNRLFLLASLCLGCCVASFGQIQRFAAQADSLLAATTATPFNGIVLITQRGKVRYRAVQGYANFPKKTLLRKHHQFVIGSISKQITAVLVLQEMDKGHLQLDDPIHKYLPQLPLGWADTITIRHLLTHMHGIVARDQPTAFPPGTQFDYGLANLAYQLLAEIVAHSSGQSFEALSAALFSQCGMRNTYHPDTRSYRQLADGYTEQPDGSLLFDSLRFQNAPAAGGFISTAADLAIWNAQLHEGHLLALATYTAMITPHPGAIRQHPLWGPTLYGLGITVTTPESLLQLGQTGFTPGYASMNYYFPASQTSIIVLSNVVYGKGNLNQAFTYHVNMLGYCRRWLE